MILKKYDTPSCYVGAINKAVALVKAYRKKCSSLEIDRDVNAFANIKKCSCMFQTSC
ncbi:TVG0329450 [Thermoplasma volcanium GSS1]|uniref:TVG0329450 protein n=1 Tax=Thermoplasma volcanium (strain ATCC 51530 / DSM 4299 / JCM 9571 / NBRC 15438 / GSS1) TaxID=273116 RepID=Q97BY0_THEVO|nr:TVG0329450 [Thermoplasma volcanium GSS1]